MIHRTDWRPTLSLLLVLVLAPSLAGTLPAAVAAPAAAADAAPTLQQESGMSGTAALDPVEARRLRFLFWAYAAIWAILAVYLVSLGVRLRAVREEIRRLRQRLDREGGAPRA